MLEIFFKNWWLKCVGNLFSTPCWLFYNHTGVGNSSVEVIYKYKQTNYRVLLWLFIQDAHILPCRDHGIPTMTVEHPNLTNRMESRAPKNLAVLDAWIMKSKDMAGRPRN